MLSCLSAVDPSPLFFTALDFEDSLSDIEELLKVSSSLSDNDTLDKNKKIELLEKAYKSCIRCYYLSKQTHPDKQLAFLISDILKSYGQLIYSESCQTSKQILLSALQMQLYAAELFDESIALRDFPTLKELKWQASSKPLLFGNIENFILTTNVDQCLTVMYTGILAKSYPNRRLFNLAEIARWLGRSYQGIDKYSLPSEINERRFKQLFTLSESLLLLVNTAESHKALGDLYYETGAFIHQLQNPKDTEGIIACYDKALACDFSVKMQAQVANMRFVTLFKEGKLPEAFPYLQKAFHLAEENDFEDGGFLKAKIQNNYAAYLMQPSLIDLDIAKTHLNKSLKFSHERRSVGEDHLIFAIFDLRHAELLIVFGEYQKAKKSIIQALSTLNKYPESNEKYVDKAMVLQEMIDEFLGIAMQAKS